MLFVAFCEMGRVFFLFGLRLSFVPFFVFFFYHFLVAMNKKRYFFWFNDDNFGNLSNVNIVL